MPLLPLCLYRHCACCSGLPVPCASPVFSCSCRDSLSLPAAPARQLTAVIPCLFPPRLPGPSCRAFFPPRTFPL